MSDARRGDGVSDGVSDGVWGAMTAAGPLAGVRVVDLGQYVAGPLAATLLADQGADVVRVDPPGGPRWDSPANATLLRGRRSVVLDLHDPTDRSRAFALATSADVVIENFRPGVAARLGVGPDECLAAAPRLVYCSLPGFGHDDPRAGDAAWEGVVMAAGGAYSAQVAGMLPGLGASATQADFSPLPLASVFAAAEAATMIAAALVARERDGLGQRIEVPLFDALFEAAGLRAMTYERNLPRFTTFGSGFYRSSDGKAVAFLAIWFRHLEWFVEAAGCHSWVEDGLVEYQRLWGDGKAFKELRRRLVELFATRTADEWERLGRSHGCAIAQLRSMQEWMAEPHAIASSTLADVADPLLGPVRLPGRAVQLSGFDAGPPAPRRVPGADTRAVVAALDAAAGRPRTDRTVPADVERRPALDGIRVLDLTRVVAGPTAAKLLAQLGADVVKVDDDPARSRASFQEPAFHEHLNRGKRSIAVDLKSEAGRALFTELATGVDVVVENFTIGTAERLGIDEAALRRRSPGLVYAYLNTFGTSGPWAPHRGFAELANTTTGITERTVDGDLPPSGAMAALDLPRWTFTDYAAGVLGAFAAVLGLYHRARTGVGVRVETSLARTTALEQVLYLVGGAETATAEPRGKATGWSPFHRLYATADGTVFVGADRAHERALLDALDVEPPGDEPPGDELERAFAARTTADVCRVLRAAGLGVHEVVSLEALMAPGGIAEQRGVRLTEQSETYGEVVMPGPVARLSGTPLLAGSLPAPFGADRASILASWGVEPAPG